MAAAIYCAFDHRYRQRVDLDSLQAHTQATVVIHPLRNERKDESWNKLYQSSVSIAVKHDVAVYKPGLAGRQLFSWRKCSIRFSQ